MTVIKLGIDEAGKGPVIGPMCIAGVCATEEQENKLRVLGVADSKKLTAKKREQLTVSIKKYITAWYIYEVSPKQIDDLRKIMTMNEIMVLCFSKVMEELSIPEEKSFDIVYLDAADISEDRFGRRVHDEYGKKFGERADQIEYVSKHRADALSPVVSAASILAKTHRDELIEDIKKKENVDFGSGYPSDPKTKHFLENYAKENGDFPDYVRKSWKTAEKFFE